MKTLKQLRTKLGATQSEVAKKINTSVPAYSLYENGQAVPCVEDMILLEREFSQPILWHDNIEAQEKAEIMQALTLLSEHYPLSSVLLFAQKALKEGTRAGKPSVLILHYANVAEAKIEPMLYTSKL